MTHSEILSREWPPLNEPEYSDILRSFVDRQNARSLFVGCDPDILLKSFIACGAEAIEAKSAMQAHDPDGYVLFRALREHRHIYIPVDGEIEFFTPDKRQGRMKDALKDVERLPLELSQPISLETLRAYYKYTGATWSGQIAGLIEMMQHYLNHYAPKSAEDREAIVRRNSLSTTILPGLSGRWLANGYTDFGTTIIRINKDRFIEKFIAAEEVEGLFPGRKRSNSILRRRCLEEISFRFVEFLSYTALLEKDDLHAVLAMHLYWFHRRTGRRTYTRATNEELSWLIGSYSTSEAHAGKVVDKLEAVTEGKVYRKGHTLHFNPTSLKKVYEDILEERL